MKRIIINYTATLLFAGLFLSMTQTLNAQSGASAVLDSALMESQLDYIHENTRVYNDYRAIRADIFLKLKKNVMDTINLNKLEIAELNSNLSQRDFQLESLNTDLARTKNEKDEALRMKNSLSFLGIQMNKALYNTIMWIIIMVLAALSVILVILFKRAHQVTRDVKIELQSLQDEFEIHRKSSREKYEKLVVSHHSEIMKLKNS